MLKAKFGNDPLQTLAFTDFCNFVVIAEIKFFDCCIKISCESKK